MRKKSRNGRRADQPAQQPRHPSGGADGVNRRRLLGGLWLGLGGVLLAEAVWVVVSFLRPRAPAQRASDAERIIDAGAVDRFAPNTVTAFPQGRFYLACLTDGGFLALSRRCTHLGCTVPWEPQASQFACPCHASLFDIRGAVIQSPATRPLDRYAVTIVNKRVIVDAGQPIRRRVFRQSEVTYP